MPADAPAAAPTASKAEAPAEVVSFYAYAHVADPAAHASLPTGALTATKDEKRYTPLHSLCSNKGLTVELLAAAQMSLPADALTATRTEDSAEDGITLCHRRRDIAADHIVGLFPTYLSLTQCDHHMSTRDYVIMFEVVDSKYVKEALGSGNSHSDNCAIGTT